MWSTALCIIASSAWASQSAGSGCLPHVWYLLLMPGCGFQAWKWTKSSLPQRPTAGAVLQAMNHLQLIFNSWLLHSGIPQHLTPCLQVKHLLLPCKYMMEYDFKGFWLHQRTGWCTWVPQLCSLAGIKYFFPEYVELILPNIHTQSLSFLASYPRSQWCTCRHVLRSQAGSRIKVVMLDIWNRGLDHRSTFWSHPALAYTVKRISPNWRAVASQLGSGDFRRATLLSPTGFKEMCVI